MKLGRGRGWWVVGVVGGVGGLVGDLVGGLVGGRFGRLVVLLLACVDGLLMVWCWLVVGLLWLVGCCGCCGWCPDDPMEKGRAT